MAYRDQNGTVHMEEQDFSCPREWLRYQELKETPGAVFRLKQGALMHIPKTPFKN